ncbi:MAG: hypothetical protein O7D34_07800 [Ignavibacteria bacterium]|nr:hypothetical protein [Ignavibacteria bacterium]
MAPTNRSLLPGIILIVLGIIFFLPNVTDLRGRELWPTFVLALGVVFYFLFLADRARYGLLMPATILTVTGLMFFYCVFEGWYIMRDIWPLFIVAPGLGFLLMYFFGKKEQGLLIPGGILIAVGLFFLGGITEYEYLWPIVLIAVGIALLFNAKRR